MSCVIGLVTSRDSVILGADTSASDGNVLITNLYDKAIMTEIGLGGDQYIDAVVGACGPTQAGIAIRRFLKLPPLSHSNDIPAYMETEFVSALRDAVEQTGFDHDMDGAGEFIVGVWGRIYFIDHTFGVASSDRGYEAIGSARDIALGSLHATRILGTGIGSHGRVRMALDAADQLTVHVAGPFTFVEAESKVRGGE